MIVREAAPAPTPAAALVDAVDAVAVTKRVAVGLLGAALAYAVVRYVVLGTVAAGDVPLYVMNKAVAFVGVAFLAAALALTPLMAAMPRLTRWGGLRKTFGVAGFAFSALHVAMTMAMLSPVYYAKLFAAGDAARFTAQGQLAVLAGIASIAALVVPAITSFGAIKAGMAPAAWRSMQKLAVVALVTAGVHVVALGWKTWINASAWPGGLPPITLVAIAVVGAALALRRLIGRRG